MDVRQVTPERYLEASGSLAGGLCGAFRVNWATGRPLVVARGDGPYVTDLEGRRLIDFSMSMGCMILGHADGAIKAAVVRVMEEGLAAAYENPYAALLAAELCEVVPSLQRVRFTLSGTEAAAYAVRVARTFTKRSKVVKFEGHYHGYSDALAWSVRPPLPQAGPVESPRAYAESEGLSPGSADDVLVLPWNDGAALERALSRERDRVAAVIMEPVNYNSGTILPRPGYLAAVRELTRHHGVVLIFDEVISGFRMCPGGAQEHYAVHADLVTMAKSIGGGTPLALFGGRADMMSVVTPSGGAAHSGTYAGHMIPMAAGLAFLERVREPRFYPELLRICDHFYRGLQGIFQRRGFKATLQHLGARFSIHFGLTEPVWDYREAAFGDVELAKRFYAACLERGVYFHSSRHHGLSIAHERPVLDDALEVIDDVVARLA
jgi:glutamate-1-semialdehyde 2,1-aminomutase